MAQKVENVIKSEDPDHDSPAALLDDYAYEDTGELEITTLPPAAWLLRVPKILYEGWEDMGEDEETQVGVIRHHTNSNTYRMILKSALKQNQNVPKEYNLRTTTENSQNTFVFSERDTPGFSSGSRGVRKPDESGRGGMDRKIDKNKKYTPYYRKAIPKQTTLTARIHRELQCLPVEDNEYRRLMLERSAAETNKRPGVTFLTGDVRINTGMVLPGGVSASRGYEGGFDRFVRTGAAPGQKKAGANKHARMPQNELLDAIYECFKEYRFWPMRSLQHRLKQPEAYLKETLSKVADLVKSGPQALTWTLKPEAQERHMDAAFNAVKVEGAAPEVGTEEESGPGNDDDDDEDDLEMEDAL